MPGFETDANEHKIHTCHSFSNFSSSLACILSQHHPLIVKDNFTEFIVSFKHFRTQSCVSIYVLPLLGCRIRLGLYSRNVLNKTFLYLQNVVAWNGQLQYNLNHLAIFSNHLVDQFWLAWEASKWLFLSDEAQCVWIDMKMPNKVHICQMFR